MCEQKHPQVDTGSSIVVQTKITKEYLRSIYRQHVYHSINNTTEIVVHCYLTSFS